MPDRLALPDRPLTDLPSTDDSVLAGYAQASSDAARPGARETEVKLSTTSEGLAAAMASPLLADGKAAPGRKLTSVYFDTPDGALRRRRIALRVRRRGRGAPVMTLKWPTADGAFTRGEVEVGVARLQPDISRFPPEVAERLEALIGGAPLSPVFETRVWRATRMVVSGSARIEAAFDEGVIFAGGRSRPIREVELELKDGAAADLYDLAARLAEQAPLWLDIVSKAERCDHFARETAPEPVKAKPIALPPGVSLDEALARILSGARDHFIQNWAPLRDGADPEAIHQMRVALRRLRAALGAFARAVPCPAFEEFREEAKGLASAMGPARDCDALRELIETGPLGHFGEASDFAPLLDALEIKRHDAYDATRALLASRQPTIFVMRLSAFIARRGWREGVAAETLATLAAPLKDFAATALERLYKRVLRRGKNLEKLPDAARHEARIALKNLRYGAEFFAPAFGEDQARLAFIKAAAHVQNLLGAHNDAVSADHFLSGRHDAEAARAAGLVSGWYARGAMVADGHIAREWKRFRKIRPFWR